MKKIILSYVIVLVCALSINAQTNKPDYSININSQSLLDNYFKLNNAGIPQCTTGKTTVMVTSVPYEGKVDCPPSRYFKYKTNKFLAENNLTKDIAFLYVNIVNCDLTSFKRITDDEITKRAPFVLIFDKDGKLIKFYYRYPTSEIPGILEYLLKQNNDSQAANSITQGRASNDIWAPAINNKNSFIQAILHPFGINQNMNDLSIMDFKHFCKERHITFYEDDKYPERLDFQINNRQIDLFDESFGIYVTFFPLSNYNTLRFHYYSTVQNSSYDLKLEDIAQILKSWGFVLQDRIIRNNEGSDRIEGYNFNIENNVHGEVYVYNNRIHLCFDYLKTDQSK